MRTKVEIEPSQRAFEAVKRLARKAAREDGWLQPSVEEHDIADTDDIGEIALNHRVGWQETTNWELTWGRQISLIVDQQEQRFLPRGDLSLGSETRYYALYEPLLEAFWDEWEERVDLAGEILKALKARDKREKE